MVRRSLLLLVAVVAFLPAPSQGQGVDRTVLLENFTGTWCPYCPFGADTVNAILATMPNVRSISYHGFPPRSEPMATVEGNTIDDSLAVTSYPGGVVDRIVWNMGGTPPTYSFNLGRSLWRQAINIRLTNAPTTPVSISVSGDYDTLNRQLSGTAHLSILQPMTGSYYVHIILTEDSLNYAQQKDGVGTLSPYYHVRVVRKVLSSALGTKLCDTGLTAPQTIDHPFSYAVPAGWNPKRCSITIFVDRQFGITCGHRNVENVLQGRWSALLNFSPVNLVAFFAEQREASVQLSWRTAGENSNSGWTIERRDDGGDWHAIGFVRGAGSTQEGHGYEFSDAAVFKGGNYDYRLRQTDMSGETSTSHLIHVLFGGKPAAMRLHQNYPNPFNPSTDIAVDLPQADHIRLDVFDAMGRLITTLADGNYGAGYHPFTWNAIDARGQQLPGGLYFYRVTTSTSSETRQMQLLK